MVGYGSNNMTGSSLIVVHWQRSFLAISTCYKMLAQHCTHDTAGHYAIACNVSMLQWCWTGSTAQCLRAEGLHYSASFMCGFVCGFTKQELEMEKCVLSDIPAIVLFTLQQQLQYTDQSQTYKVDSDLGVWTFRAWISIFIDEVILSQYLLQYVHYFF